jgi:hypothetical protein
MAAIDLITNARARVNLPNVAAGADNDAVINTLITACSRAIMRYCKRAFASDTYDELYSGRAERQIFLRNYPLQSVQSVRYRPVTVLKVTNTLVNTPQARVEVLSTGLRLTRVTSGSKVTVTSGLDFASNTTLTALVSAVNAVGSSWSAQVVADYAQWPSIDLYCPNGSTTDPGNNAGQGAIQCVAGSQAELKLHTYELAGFQINERQGGLLRAIPYTDPELLHPQDLIWPIGVNNFRIQYTAGYATIPEDLQEACAEWVSTLYNLTLRDPALAQQVPASGTSSGWTPVFSGRYGPPPWVRQLLSGYRSHCILVPGG